MRRNAAISTCAILLCLAGCGDDPALDRTIATVEGVRGEAHIGDTVLERIGRAAAEQEISVAERGLARLSMDSGPQLLLDARARVAVIDEAKLRLTAGRVYAEAGPSEELFVESERGSFRASDAAVSASIARDSLSVYVVRGEVSWTSGQHRGVARAGERLTVRANGGTTAAETLWDDWTGGLARPGPGDATGAAGVGVLEARVPDEIGQARWPLVIRRLDVRVQITGDLAVTEVEQVFFNPASETVEGLYRIRVPEAAVLQRFAVDRNGALVDGYVREQQQARAAYEAQVYRGSTLDPALLEWVAPGSYQARIYPIYPGEARRIVVRYAEWLSGIGEEGPRLYRYPMGGGRRAPRIQELAIAVDFAESGAERVRAGMGAAIEEGQVRLRRSDFAPRSDFWLELIGGERAQRAWRAAHEPPPRAPDARAVPNEADERDYWYLPLRLPAELAESARSEGTDLVIVADISAATDRAHLELGRTVVEALTAHLGERDRVAIVTSDLTIRALSGDRPELGPAQGARIEGLLDALARIPSGGATDLGAALGSAAALLDPERPGAVIYVGDGAPTVGELEAEGLLERMARLPSPPRLYAVGIGSEANLDLLDALTRGGGLAMRVEERSVAADAALSILAHVTRPVAQRVTVDVGTGIENGYPRRPVDVVIGDVLSVVGRVRGEPPSQVTVRGTIAGEEFETTIDVETVDAAQSTDLRLRWAGERLRQLLLDGAGREEVAELGTRYGLITPYTSYYVPSAQELAQMGPSAMRWIEQPRLLASRPREENGIGDVLLTVALGPLAIAGCASEEDVAAPTSSSPLTRHRDEEGAMGEAEPSGGSANRYGLEGPGDSPNAQMAREQARDQAAEVVAEAMDVPAEPPPPQGAPSPTTVAPAAEAAPSDGTIGLGGLGAIGHGGGGGGVAANGALPAMPSQAQQQPQPPAVTGTEIENPWGDATGGEERSRRTASRPRPMRGATLEPEAPARGGRADVDDVLAGLDGLDNEADRREGEANQHRIVIVTTTTTDARHARSRCSDAADLPLRDRNALWSERLGQAGGPSGWVDVFRNAISDCEAPSWRDRRELLGLIVAQAGSIERMLDVYRLFDSAAARGYLRSVILRRVRSPEDLRAIRAAFGLGHEPDWALVEQILERANGDDAKVRALRRLAAEYPDSFDLKLRLLELLETAGRPEEARRLADRLRGDPRSDAGVRTAVGEMFLRMDREEEARRVFSEIVEFAPLDELARRRLGDLYRAHGWFEDAYRQYQTLASIRPDDPTVLLLLAQAAAGTGRIDEALRLEQRLMETAEPGAEHGIARIAQLWSSVRLAKMRAEARTSRNARRVEEISVRTRRSGVLAGAGDLRVTLVWSHPDAQLALWTGHPGDSLARPEEIAPEHGIEAFDVPEQESGAYRVEVRRADPNSPTPVSAELVMVWHEGQDDEVVRVVPLEFRRGRGSYSWSLRGNELTEAAQ